MRNDIETVVFDLDGTIYQNTVFHHDYLHFLVEGTCYECWQQKLVEFAEQVYAGKRLHMNSFYTPEEAELPNTGSVFQRAGTVPLPAAYLPAGAGNAGLALLGRCLGCGDSDWKGTWPFRRRTE